MQEFYTFLNSAQNSASFDTLHTQFRRIFFSTLIRDSAVFLEVKSSNKIEIDKNFKNAFLWTSLRISRPNQNHMKQSDLGKSLDPTAYPFSKSSDFISGELHILYIFTYSFSMPLFVKLCNQTEHS